MYISEKWMYLQIGSLPFTYIDVVHQQYYIPPKKKMNESPLKKGSAFQKEGFQAFSCELFPLGVSLLNPPRWVMFLGFCSTFTNLPNLSFLHNLLVLMD